MEGASFARRTGLVETALAIKYRGCGDRIFGVGMASYGLLTRYFNR